MQRILGSLAIIAGTAFAQSVKPLITVDPATRQIKDQYGRSVIFHGVNVVYKIPPYIPTQE